MYFCLIKLRLLAQALQSIHLIHKNLYILLSDIFRSLDPLLMTKRFDWFLKVGANNCYVEPDLLSFWTSFTQGRINYSIYAPGFPNAAV